MSHPIRGKDPSEVSAEDFKKLVKNDVKESSSLEYKGSDSLGRNGLIKEICAFLNSDGGNIIVGIEEDEDKEVPDALGLKEGNLDKERLSQQISSNIEPFPDGVEIHEVETYDEKYGVVIEVPKSNNPPHMFTKSNHYYIRVDNRKERASHGQVEALFGKRNKPVIKPYIDVKRQVDSDIEVDIGIFNNGEVGTEKANLFIRIDQSQTKYLEAQGTLSDQKSGGFHNIGVSQKRELAPEYTSKLGSLLIEAAETEIELVIRTGTLKDGDDIGEYSFSLEFFNEASKSDSRLILMEPGDYEKLNLQEARKGKAGKALITPISSD